MNGIRGKVEEIKALRKFLKVGGEKGEGKRGGGKGGLEKGEEKRGKGKQGENKGELGVIGGN